MKTDRQQDPALRGRRYLTLDDFATLQAARSAPEALVAGEEPVTIDEVQRSPELLLAVKREIDRRRAPGRFLLSGSANLALLDGVSDSLAGRALYLTLQPFSRRERLVSMISTWRCQGHALSSLDSKRSPHLNPNSGTMEFSLRDPDGYYVTISALSAA